MLYYFNNGKGSSEISGGAFRPDVFGSGITKSELSDETRTHQREVNRVPHYFSPRRKSWRSTETPLNQVSPHLTVASYSCSAGSAAPHHH